MSESIEPKWLQIARNELGVHEMPGSKATDRILLYDHAAGLKTTSDEVPWCSSFACWCMENAGIAGTGNAMARSWLKWGQKIDEPRIGCVVVLKRIGSKIDGHVGFYVGHDAGSKTIQLLGGNQGDKVCVASFHIAQVLGFRWPSGIPD